MIRAARVSRGFNGSLRVVDRLVRDVALVPAIEHHERRLAVRVVDRRSGGLLADQVVDDVGRVRLLVGEVRPLAKSVWMIGQIWSAMNALFL